MPVWIDGLGCDAVHVLVSVGSVQPFAVLDGPEASNDILIGSSVYQRMANHCASSHRTERKSDVGGYRYASILAKAEPLQEDGCEFKGCKGCTTPLHSPKRRPDSALPQRRYGLVRTQMPVLKHHIGGKLRLPPWVLGPGHLTGQWVTRRQSVSHPPWCPVSHDRQRPPPHTVVHRSRCSSSASLDPPQEGVPATALHPW